ncbi:uncharacterized protein LOC129596272 [Paramacrobiotus metropolitanus]|uniref:uncharacterized protein LOC129596272 n=1 Tax=Paramacrobiotus metropolitanus TaxID=2943436 RepID=UPI002445990C|nr:uncharacterized protein LOC129596272 [Paramacrobiotus metropolitanus]XP_055349483.1 uncharacterized protein LOC129596272 [Paramacrobiotus metropolitanus]
MQRYSGSQVGEWGRPEQYNLTSEQLQIIEERAQRRANLKNEYFRTLYNPWKNMSVEGGTVFDPMMQRFTATRADYYHYFKPNKANFMIFFFSFIFPVTVLGYHSFYTQEKFDRRCRNAEVPWRYRMHRTLV